MLELDLIRIDGGTQSRVELNQDTVTEYAEAYLTGATMPPVIVFYDGSDRWLADGFHRYFGAKMAGLSQIYENIIPGTLRDAVLYSLKANATHGLKRTNADKRRAVETMLADPEWASWSDRKVAELCGVTHPFVASLRPGRVVTVTTPARASPVSTRPTASDPAQDFKSPSVPLVQATQSSAAASKSAVDIPETEPERQAHAAVATAGTDDKVAVLEREVVALRESLTEAHGDIDSMAQILDAGDQLKAALAEAKTSRDLARGLQVRIDSMLTEIAELNRQVKYWKKKAGQPA